MMPPHPQHLYIFSQKDQHDDDDTSNGKIGLIAAAAYGFFPSAMDSGRRQAPSKR